MNLPISVDQKQLMDVLLNVSTVRPVFIWGPPGIGKSAIVEQFASDVGLECVSLLGSQLAPEDIIGVPQIVEGRSVFCPPRMIARERPYCLFLDELNACSQEVQKAFYSLILEQRIGEYRLPEGSIVVGAGNRSHDNAITKPMSSALLDRMFHVELRVDSRLWLEWAAAHGIHPWVYDYICARPDQLWSQPPKTEEPFSTPRSWHMLSDALNSCGGGISEQEVAILANGCLTAAHATQFAAYVRQVHSQYSLKRILNGEQRWPDKPEERDVLYFLAQSFRAQLLKELPRNRGKLSGEAQALALRAKELLVELGIGAMPEGGLFEPQFHGLTAEAVYDQLWEDVRYYQGQATGDLVYGDEGWWDGLEGQATDAFYRSALQRGLAYHQSCGRGSLPSGLVEEIYAISRPPIRWDVELAKWFDENFAPLERRRSYARLSRRQSSTPDIPRPAWRAEEVPTEQRIFGVVLDTSSSMDRALLAAALGSIASYSQAREVHHVRVVFCDAAAYDQGIMSPEEIAGAVRVRGRGGTALQPAIDLLDRDPKFPKDAPVLIITDGDCDRLTLGGRDHAFLIPAGRRLPFLPRGPVFRLK